MKIILDNIIFSLQEKGGITSYWIEVVNGLHKYCEGNENTDLVEINANFTKRGLFSSLFFIFERYKWVPFYKENDKCVFHSSYYRSLKIKQPNIKKIVTVHDFTYELFSNGFKKHLHVWQKKSAIKDADIIICVSENTRRDLLRIYPRFSNKKIKVIYHGCSKDYFKIANNQDHDNYFLFVGSRAHYKNFPYAVENIAKYTNSNLVIVGKKLKRNEEKLLNKFLPHKWNLYKSINNSILNKLYNNAIALIYPSNYEGFGIPLLEAMASGCPFIALNNSSIPEVAGNAGVLLNDLNGEEFERAIRKIKNERHLIVNEGFNQVKKFSWEKCINETIHTYFQAFA